MNLPELPPYVRDDIPRQVEQALAEDVGEGDLTARLIPSRARSRARILCREDAVLCGTAWADEVFRQLGDDVGVTWRFRDGEPIPADTVLCTLEGNSRHILTGERTALNFLQTLMGTATATARYVAAVAGKNVTLLDTRKTVPGLRTAQKYAVLCGGGGNHRIALYDAFLIKENHIAACGSIAGAIDEARRIAPERRVIVEVETLDELAEAIAARPDQIMLDDFSAELTATALARIPDDITVELSGNFTLARLHGLPAFPRPVVISIGALTKHVQAVDLSLRLLAD